jgi:hypothetical protein
VISPSARQALISRRNEAALRRIAELHRPVLVTFWTASGTGGGRKGPVCEHCDTGDPYCTVSQDWPCPTAALLPPEYLAEPQDDGQ